jgi:hypothetical protein
MGGKILLFFLLKIKDLEGQRESYFLKCLIFRFWFKKVSHKLHKFSLISLNYNRISGNLCNLRPKIFDQTIHDGAKKSTSCETDAFDID